MNNTELTFSSLSELGLLPLLALRLLCVHRWLDHNGFFFSLWEILTSIEHQHTKLLQERTEAGPRNPILSHSSVVLCFDRMRLLCCNMWKEVIANTFVFWCHDKTWVKAKYLAWYTRDKKIFQICDLIFFLFFPIKYMEKVHARHVGIYTSVTFLY